MEVVNDACAAGCLGQIDRNHAPIRLSSEIRIFADQEFNNGQVSLLAGDVQRCETVLALIVRGWPGHVDDDYGDEFVPPP